MSVEGDLQHSLRIGDTVLLYVKDAHGYVFSELSRYAPVHLQRAVLLAALCGDTCSPHTFSPSAAAPSTTPWQLPPAAPFGSPTWPTCTVSPCTPQRSGMAACVCVCGWVWVCDGEGGRECVLACLQFLHGCVHITGPLECMPKLIPPLSISSLPSFPLPLLPSTLSSFPTCSCHILCRCSQQEQGPGAADRPPEEDRVRGSMRSEE